MISIIVPCYNQHDMTEQCLSAVLENTQDCELIVIDNGSDPPIKPPFSGFIETRIIRNDDNKGFPVAVNQGIREARGDVIVLLNNDVIVTKHWAERLTDALKDYAIVGPVTNFCAGMQIATVEAYTNRDELEKAAEGRFEEYGAEIHEVNFIIGFCMMFRKSVFDEIGDFDESLWPCSGEEVDFCFRAREAGHRVGVALGCYMHHEGSQTFNEMDAAGKLNYQEICTRNDKHLAEKWGNDFWQQQLIVSSPKPQGVCLNLGCGSDRLPGYINIDNRAEVGPDLVCDALKGLPYDDGSVDMIRAYDFLEHIPIGKTVQVVEEIYRVLKPGGVFESSTPDAEMGQGAFQDPHHVSFWVENSWLYYSDLAMRKLYGIKANFEIEIIQRVETDRRVYHLHVIAKARKG